MVEFEYIYPLLNRIQCEEILQNKRNGTFLVRVSESNRSNYVLVVNWDGKAHHYKIMRNETGLFYLEHAVGATVYYFETLDDLVTHYKSNAMNAYNQNYRLIEPASEEFQDYEYDDEEDELSDFSDTEDENITPFFQQQLNAMKGFRTDKALTQLLKDYVDKNAIKDFQFINSGGCKAPFVQELLVNGAAELHLALQNYLKRLETIHQLFDLGYNITEKNERNTDAALKSKQDTPKDLESIFKMLSKCKNSVLSLEKKALNAFGDFGTCKKPNSKFISKVPLEDNRALADNVSADSGVAEPGENHEIRKVESQPIVTPQPIQTVPQKKDKQFEVTSGPLKSKSLINIDVVKGQIIFLKNANDKPETGVIYVADQITQLIKSKTSKFKLKMVIENTPKSYNFADYVSRELFCQTIQQVKIAHSNEPTSSAELSIFVGTWNMGSSNLTGDISSWFKCVGTGKTNNSISEYALIPSDIYAFGTQESAYHEKEWVTRLKNDLQQTYSREFRQVISSSLWGIRIVIFVKAELSNLINTVKQSSVKTGIANALGNKGAVGISFNMGTTSFCFVNAHLTSGTEKLRRRNQNYLDILRGLGLGQEDGFDITLSFHHIFWMGDLNYRLELKEEDIPMIIKKRMTQDLEGLLEFDQLINVMEEKKVFIDFQEQELHFPPTYKYTKGSRSMYDWKKEKRTEIRINVPSWCDRVLWRSYPDLPSYNTTYGCTDNIVSSDHSPVFSTFNVGVLSQKMSNNSNPEHSENALRSTKLVFQCAEAKISTRSASKFVIVFHSNCIEKQVVTRPSSTSNCSHQMESLMRKAVTSGDNTNQHCYPCWTKADIPPICPVLSDPNYLEDQHLLIAIKGEDGQESYGECVVSFKRFLSGGLKTVECNLTHLGLGTGNVVFKAEMQTPSDYVYRPSVEKSIYTLIKIEEDEASDPNTQKKHANSDPFLRELKHNLINFPIDRSAIQQVEPEDKIADKSPIAPSPNSPMSKQFHLEKRRSIGIDNFASRGMLFDTDAEKGMSLPMSARKPSPQQSVIQYQRNLLKQSSSTPDMTSPPPVVPHSNRTSKQQSQSSINNDCIIPLLPPKRKSTASLSSDSSSVFSAGPGNVASSSREQTSSRSFSSSSSTPLLHDEPDPIPKPRLKKKKERIRSDDIYLWLENIHYTQYYEMLLANGFDDLNFYHDLSVGDLTSIGINAEHSTDIVKCAKLLKKLYHPKGPVAV